MRRDSKVSSTRPLPNPYSNVGRKAQYGIVEVDVSLCVEKEEEL